MTQRFVVDEILHAFESDGNLHVVFGVSSGLVNAQGDVKDPQVILVIPGSKALAVNDELGKAIVHFELDNPTQKSQPVLEPPTKQEILGPAIELKFTQDV